MSSPSECLDFPAEVREEDHISSRIRGFSIDHFFFDDMSESIGIKNHLCRDVANEMGASAVASVPDPSMWRLDHERGLSADICAAHEFHGADIPLLENFADEKDALHARMEAVDASDSGVVSSLLTSYGEDEESSETKLGSVRHYACEFDGSEGNFIDVDGTEIFAGEMNHCEGDCIKMDCFVPDGIDRIARPHSSSSNASGRSADAASKTGGQSSNDVRRVGAYTLEERAVRIARFNSKRATRIWRKKIKYDCRKKLADSRPRLKGRFVTAKEKSLAMKMEERSSARASGKANLRSDQEDTSSVSSETYDFEPKIRSSAQDPPTYLGRGGRLAARKAAMFLNSL